MPVTLALRCSEPVGQLRAEADAGRHDDRNGRRGAARRRRGRRAGSHQNIDLETHKFCRRGRKPFGAPIGPAEFKADVGAFGVAKLVQAPLENIPERQPIRIGRSGFQNADALHGA